jgi:putative transcriptional regulator
MVAKRGRRRGPVWNARQVRALRQHLGLTQEQMAAEMGTRQQTISEWETGQYQPRGTSARLLALIAERGGFPYRAESQEATVENQGRDRD